MGGEVRSSLASGVLRLTIYRPEHRNALNREVLTGLREAIRQAARNRSVRVIALTGAGDKVFCAGADLKSSSSDHDAARPFSPRDYRELLSEILRCPKPTVALARGHVLAGGMGIFLACDLALACDDIHFSTPEINVGMFPMMVLALLYRHVGRKKAVEMLFFGERVPAATALKLGLVNRMYPRAQFDAQANEFLGKLAEKSGSILGLGKKAIRHVEDRDLLKDLRYLESELAHVIATADSKEGMRAFLEKRNPVWKDE
jgi:enoyl-CoA hydratase